MQHIIAFPEKILASVPQCRGFFFKARRFASMSPRRSRMLLMIAHDDCAAVVGLLVSYLTVFVSVGRV
jgi:hypothetical protein